MRPKTPRNTRLCTISLQNGLYDAVLECIKNEQDKTPTNEDITSDPTIPIDSKELKINLSAIIQDALCHRYNIEIDTRIGTRFHIRERDTRKVTTGPIQVFTKKEGVSDKPEDETKGPSILTQRSIQVYEIFKQYEDQIKYDPDLIQGGPIGRSDDEDENPNDKVYIGATDNEKDAYFKNPEWYRNIDLIKYLITHSRSHPDFEKRLRAMEGKKIVYPEGSLFRGWVFSQIHNFLDLFLDPNNVQEIPAIEATPIAESKDPTNNESSPEN